ncbi:MAG TPA: NAD-dependent epimerase/dehydratase family protein [Acidobacteriota bacterium]|nr:NAD-dependent epimerase/dehydratase family protein [Acidobacteriota bacterium]
MKQTALVTGGAGFIGSHLCDALLAEGFAVRVLDNLSTGKESNVPAGCDLLRGSILDEAALRNAMREVSIVLHNAARVSIRDSIDHFLEDAETNLFGTLRVLQASAAAGVRRFIYASSMAVYADSPQPRPIPENAVCEPISPYGIAKLASERYVFMLGKELRIEPVVLRYFNTYGTRQTFTPYVGVLTIFVTQLLQRKPITIFGDGEQIRDFVSVADVVQANLLAVRNPAAAGQTFNIGTSKGTSVNSLAQMLRARIYPDAEVIHKPARPEELRFSIADISNAKRVLHYEPRGNLAADLTQIIPTIQNS